MKNLLLLLCFFSFTSCIFNKITEPEPDFYRYEPVVLSRAEFENSITIQDKTAISESSKIYIIGNYIFINDKRKGFHIFDNSNPANPVKKKFLNIPGATDIAIRNNVLYINQATDLVVLSFDFSNFTLILNNRLKNVFPEIYSPDGDVYFEDDKVVVNWIEK